MTNSKEKKLKYNQQITIAINIIMVIVVGYYTFCARAQLEEARISNQLNQKVALSNFSSTQKSLDMTQEMLKATKGSLDRMNENVKILKNTQNAKIVLDYVKVNNIDFDNNVPTEAFVAIRNIGTVPATFGDNSYVCAVIAEKPPGNSECTKLFKSAVNSGNQSTLGPGVQGYGLRTKVPEKITKSQKELLKTGALHLYIKGDIPYSDYLSKRNFPFCYQWQYTDEHLRSDVPTIPISFEANWVTCSK